MTNKMGDNKRIEKVFSDLYQGRNQIIFSGGVDDLFLVAGKKQNSLRLCSLEKALIECGKKRDYDLIITVKDNMTLAFGDADLPPNLRANDVERKYIPEEQEKLFNSLVERDTWDVQRPEGVEKEDLVDLLADPGTPAPKAKAPGDGAPAAQKSESARRAEAAGERNRDINMLEQVTRVLERGDKRVLVIFPYPEKMFLLSVDIDVLRKMETVVKSWRNIIRTAHPDSRSILIVNPHRLEEFQKLEHRVACYDHNCQVIQIGLPDRIEMRAWLEDYADRNSISGKPYEWDRVVLAGKAHPNSNLQNFVGWVQGFFLKDKEEIHCLETLLKAENVDAVESKEDLLQKLNKMIGLDEVKEKINRLVNDVGQGGGLAAGNSYHMLFLGAPGTGKTVVANLIAKLFWAMELRPSRKTVSIAIHDIVGGNNEGQGIQRMKAKIAEAMGGVLFVDEAYLFAESEWGRKAFQVLLTEMENHRDNLTVILAGYENRLQALKDINEGFDSRIPIKLHFHDYTKEQKLEIFKLILDDLNKEKKTNLKLSREAEPHLLRILERSKDNARGVRTIVENAVSEYINDSDRDKKPLEIVEKHIIDPHKYDSEACKEIIEDIKGKFIGMDSLKQQLWAYFYEIEYNVARNEKLNLPKASARNYRLRFTGPPGTGKTSVARYMGRFFHAMGITETDECVECGATTLKGAFVGHAQQAVNRLFHENRNKVIFIDEIYSLYNPQAGQNDTFGREAIDTLVRCLTAEEYQDTVVIVAGYKDEVEACMNANPGLASRIPKEIEFSDYSAEECVEIFRKMARDREYRLLDGTTKKDPEKASDILKELFEILRVQKNFGNARTVNDILELAIGNLVLRIHGKDRKDCTEDDYRNILKEDVRPILDREKQKANR